VADWVTISSLATAAGTLVLAVATFASVRSSNRSARVAERALLVGLRPVLAASRRDDPGEKVRFGDDHWLVLEGGYGAVEESDGNVYMGVLLRNAGQGMAVLHSWRATTNLDGRDHSPLERFHRHTRDLYVAPGDVGFWQGAMRDPSGPDYAEVLEAVVSGAPVSVEVLYGDHEGGQRTITRLALFATSEGGPKRLCSVARHWYVDGHDPR
jgi:hypothetical protein